MCPWEKQHRCSICGDTFGYANTLQHHLKDQHKEWPYPATSSVITHHSTSVSLRDPDQVISGHMMTSPDYQLIQPVPRSPDRLEAAQQVTVERATPQTYNE